MKFSLEVNNKTKLKISKKVFLDIFKFTINQSSIDFLPDASLQLSIAIVDPLEMQDLNRQYRKKDKPTDVLSFFEYESIQEISITAKKEKELFLGELILCPDYIEKNAKEDGEPFEYAFTYITSHGILHLLGYPHGKKMFTLQRKVADQLRGNF